MSLEQYSFQSGEGLLLSTEAVPNGNMLETTAQFLLLSLPTELTGEDHNKYVDGIDRCERGDHYPGLFYREPARINNTSVDDYLSLCGEQNIAQDVYYAGCAGLGFFDVAKPYQVSMIGSTWLWRFQGFWQHVKINARRKVYPLGRLIWAASILIAALQPASNQDSWIQSHLMILTATTAGYKSFIGRMAVRYWKWRKPKETWRIVADKIKIEDHPLVNVWKPYG